MSSTMTTRRKVLGLALPLAAAAVCAVNALPAHAGLIDIEIEPPHRPPPHERVPPPRHGFVWAPGYWRWEGHRHVWEPGHWERERHGHHWVPARWVQVGRHYRFEEGHWD